ncbi:NAD-dependent epimerase/dehydratase family protein, partial [Proteus terrae]
RWRALRGDVTDAEAVRGAVSPGLDVLVLGAAVTAGTQREADDPAGILQVNVLALPGILQAARAARVRRVIQLSSAAVYGRAALGAEPVAETSP